MNLNVCFQYTMPPNYSLTKIYKIAIDDLLYVGSTVSPLYARKAQHKCDYARQKKSSKLHQKILEKYGGWSDEIKLILVHNFPCNDKNEKTAEEERVRQELEAKLNSQVCQWPQDPVEKNEHINLLRRDLRKRNPEKFRDRAKKWNEKNKDKVAERQKKNYEEHREERLAYAAKQREEHKKEIAESYKMWYAKNKDKKKAQVASRWRALNMSS